MRWLVLFGTLAFLPGPSLFAEETPRKIKPVMVWTGTDSKQAKESFARCCTQEDWKASWHKHHARDKETDNLTCPEVDFDSYMVITIFHGKSFQNHGIRIMAVLDEKDCVRVQYRPSWYQVAIRRGDVERSYDTQSYAFVVLPRSPKAIVLEEDVQSYIGEPPVWKERAKLAAVEKK